MNIYRHFDLKPHNTMALASVAEYFCEVFTPQDVREALAYAGRKNLPVAVIGGGSNIILHADIPGMVIRVMIPGIVKHPPDTGAGEGSSHIVEVGAGENWHQLVTHCLAQRSFGLENLSLIPGYCGAAPIQNIGAYGVELDEVFDSLDAIDMASGEPLTMTKADCRFSYRDSIFKRELRGKVIITRLRLRLSSAPSPRLEYPALRDALAGKDTAELTPQLVAQTVCDIRSSKLPDPAWIANVGSFFKNPVVETARAEALRAEFPGLVSYPAGEGHEKLAAAWLVDQAGWKGLRRGSVGVHDRQALVLVNTGGATGGDVLELAADITESVKQRYGVELEIEPQLIR